VAVCGWCWVGRCGHFDRLQVDNWSIFGRDLAGVAVTVADWSVSVANRVAVAMWQWHNRLQCVIAVILIGDKLTIGALWAEFGYKLGGSGSGSGGGSQQNRSDFT
jgi:hypothetical protein